MSITNNDKINIILDAMGGTCTTKHVTVGAGERVVLEEPKREGYAFLGWFTKRSGEGDRIVSGEQLPNMADSSGEVRLYAFWEKKNTSVAEGRTVSQARRRSRSLLFKQRLAVAIMLCVVILAAVVFAAVSSYIKSLPISFTDPNDGEMYEIRRENGMFSLYTTDGKLCPITDDGYFITEYGTLVYISPSTGEYSVDNGRELIFESLQYNAYNSAGGFLSGCDETNAIQRIDISNSEGKYAFVRDEGNSFLIEGMEQVSFDKETFAQIATGCGYTLAILKLESPKTLADGSVDYSEYGLVEKTYTKLETNDKGEQVEVEYTYTPACYTITTVSGDTYTVHIGDLTVTEDSYYVRYEGKDGVYVLSKSGREYVTKGVEAVVTPQLVYKVGEIEYVDVSDFMIIGDIDYKKINEALADRFGDDYDVDKMSEKEAEEFYRYYEELMSQHGKKVCHFSYQDMNERKNSIYSSNPFVSFLEYSRGYYINTTSVSNMLEKIYNTDFEGVMKLNPTMDELHEYGLALPDYIISFYYVQLDEDGEEKLIYNQLHISEKLIDGSYFAYSSTYDMIVNVSTGCFSFLEWSEFEWYDPNYIQHNIGHITDITVQAPGTDIEFAFDDSQTLAGEIGMPLGNGFTDTKGKEYLTVQDGGRFKLTAAGNEVMSGFGGDYLVTATPYFRGNAQSDYFLFTELVSNDSNGDGVPELYTRYYYHTMYSKSGYILAATTENYLPDGTLISQGATVEGKPIFTTEYFVTDTLTTFVYYTARDSKLGESIDALYKDHPSYSGDAVRLGGVWHRGSVYTSANGAFVIVDSDTGEWAQVQDYRNGLYIADRSTSALASSSYITDGTDLTPRESFFPLIDGILSYNYDTKKLEIYDKVTKTKRNANTDDCAPGIWCDGDFYALKTGQLVVVDGRTGDICEILLDDSTQFIANVYANSKKLDYLLHTTTTTGVSKTVTALANFQEFYLDLLFANFEGVCDLTEEEMAALRKLDDFSTGGADNPCILKLKISAKDFKGNERHVVYRFYRISERRAYITLEWLDSADSPSSPENATGSFYVLASFADKIIADANKVVNGELVSSGKKY